LRRVPDDAFSGDEEPPPVLYGYEVLLRLPDGDAHLAPGAFLPQAERFELLPALDGWVLDRLAAVLAERQAPPGTRFHINVGAASLLDPGYRAHLAAALRDGRFAPGQLCLELKESDMMGLLMPVLPALSELTPLGLRLMLDDYGRGFGGLGHLRSLPLASVKLEGSLVQTLTHDDLGETLVRAMTDVAHAMNLLVIAPLVEDADTLRRLRAAGVDCAQGFALGLPAEAWVVER
jgi:EAL domain-containing protein (putative c-di-GMP-specific phosphodiesterase class I)